VAYIRFNTINKPVIKKSAPEVINVQDVLLKAKFYIEQKEDYLFQDLGKKTR